MAQLLQMVVTEEVHRVRLAVVVLGVEFLSSVIMLRSLISPCRHTEVRVPKKEGMSSLLMYIMPLYFHLQ